MMKDMYNDEVLNDLIHEVEVISRIRNALPSTDVMSDEMMVEYNNLSKQEFDARMVVYERLLYLVKEEGVG